MLTDSPLVEIRLTPEFQGSINQLKISVADYQ
jgi:hypothetical protein